MTRVCLALIVRDEAPIIERCLASVVDHIDRWIVCDTGSTDDTAARIESSLAGIGGRIEHHEWHDFATNRNALLGEVAADITAGHLDPDDLLLLLDADHTVTFDDGWIDTLNGLGGDGYQVPIGGSLGYRMPYVVRAGRSWRYVGATHEYLGADGSFELLPTDAVRIDHHADGGTRPVKFERDLALLQEAAATHPDDPRTWFYLPQTLKDLGRNDEAIAAYRRRAELGGYHDEVYLSLLWVGRLVAVTDSASAVDAWTRALDISPQRVECHFELSRHLRAAGRYRAAWAFARAALEVEPSPSTLFAELWVQQWAMALEAAVAAWWAGRPDAGLAVCDDLLASDALPTDQRAAVADVRSWCLGPDPGEVGSGPRTLSRSISNDDYF